MRRVRHTYEHPYCILAKGLKYPTLYHSLFQYCSNVENCRMSKIQALNDTVDCAKRPEKWLNSRVQFPEWRYRIIGQKLQEISVNFKKAADSLNRRSWSRLRTNSLKTTWNGEMQMWHGYTKFLAYNRRMSRHLLSRRQNRDVALSPLP